MEFLTYKPLYLLGLLAILAFFYARSLVDRPRLMNSLSVGCRGLALIFIILAVCRPFMSAVNTDSHTIHVLDVSESVDTAGIKQALDKIDAYNAKLLPGDSYQVFLTADGIRETTVKRFREELESWMKQAPDGYFRRASLLSEALTHVRFHFPAEKAGRLILYSDGRPTGASVSGAIEQLKNERIIVSFEGVPGVHAPEAGVIALTPSSTTAYQGERIRLTAEVFSNKDMTGHLHYVSKGVVWHEEDVSIKAGRNSYKCDVLVGEQGDEWQVELQPANDTFPVNNHGECRIELIGNSKILVLHKKPEAMRHFRRALQKQGFTVDCRSGHGLPANLKDMLAYDALVLANVPATQMSRRQMEMINRYVRDFGGGLMMLGSDNSFGLGGYFQTPIEDVLPLSSRFEKEKEKPSLAMVLVIDKSGSMSGEPIAMARQAAKATVELLGQRDQIAIVGFDSEYVVLAEMTSASDTSRLHLAIDSLEAGGGTSMFPAMDYGRSMLNDSSAKIKHMIILGDGQSEGGDFEGLAEEMGSLGVTVSTVALGSGCDKELMSRIADLGRGRYYETEDANNVPQIFTKETMEASRSAIVEEPFSCLSSNTEGFLQGLDMEAAPMLLGHVQTQVKSIAKVPLMTEEGKPLLAVGRFGLGQSVAFTSDATAKWASEWIDWPSFGKFWSQVLRGIIRTDRGAGVSVKKKESSGDVTYIIRNINEKGGPLNSVDWQVMCLDDQGATHKLVVHQSGLGIYQAVAPQAPEGAYSIRFSDHTNRKTRIISEVKGYPKEYQLHAKATALLTGLAPAAAIERAPRPEVDVRDEAGHYFLITAMALLIVGIVLRRI